MSRVQATPSTPLQTYRAHRFHWLEQLLRVRAMGRIGTASPQSLAKERKGIIGELAKLRRR